MQQLVQGAHRETSTLGRPCPCRRVTLSQQDGLAVGPPDASFHRLRGLCLCVGVRLCLCWGDMCVCVCVSVRGWGENCLCAGVCEGEGV